MEHVLSDEGFIGLVYDRASGNAMFHSATSAHRPRRFADTEEGRAAWTGERLGAQLPYVFLVCRLAHFLKWVQREKIGQWNDRAALQKELDTWLRQYVSDVDDPHWETRSRRPLRKASILIEAVVRPDRLVPLPPQAPAAPDPQRRVVLPRAARPPRARGDTREE
jgi:type VI secretion system protein ImpC